MARATSVGEDMAPKTNAEKHMIQRMDDIELNLVRSMRMVKFIGLPTAALVIGKDFIWEYFPILLSFCR